MDKSELKAQAFKQRIAEMVADYEEKVAELRVEYTVLRQEYNDAMEEITKLKESNVSEEDSDTA